MNHDDAVAIQWLCCNLTDDPGMFRKPPMQALLEQCHDARYGDGDGGRDWLDSSACPF